METRPVWQQPNHPAWTFHGLTTLHGGPKMSTIAEHSHAEAQVSVHFRPSSSQHVHLYAPGQPHTGGWDQGSEVIVFHLAPLLLTEVAAELSREDIFEIRPFNLGRDRVLEQMAALVLREFRSPGRVGSFYVESIGHVVAGHILRTYAEIHPSSLKCDGLSARELRIVRRFIEDRIEWGFSVPELAQCTAMGPRQFARKLKLATGLSPWRYVQKERLSMALRLLKNQSIPVSDIACKLGFVDQSHFTNAFRLRQGVTPTEYRRGI